MSSQTMGLLVLLPVGYTDNKFASRGDKQAWVSRIHQWDMRLKFYS